MGNRIRSARKRAGLTQAEVAEKIGISWQGIAQWETGKRNPKIDTLKKIAQALSIPVEELTGGLTIDNTTMFYGKPAIDFLEKVSSILAQGKQVVVVPSDGEYKIFEVGSKEVV